MEYLKKENAKAKDEFVNSFINYSGNPNLEIVHNVRVLASETSPKNPLDKNADTSSDSKAEEEKAKIIWKRLKKGDMDALGELYELYADELFSYGMEKVHNKTLVMDSIHDLYVNLYKYRSKTAVPTNVKYYLLKSIKHEVYRKQASKKHINTDAPLLENKKFNTGLSYEEELIEAEHLNEKKNKLRTVFRLLTKRQQKVIQLKFAENRSYSEIAETMNISTATSRTLVYRALTVLRKHFVSLVFIAIHIIY